MRFQDLPLVLSTLSLGRFTSAIAYAFRRDRIDARYLEPPTTQAEDLGGSLLASEFHGSWASFTFPAAGLELAALADDLLRVTWTPGMLPPPYALDRVEWPGAHARWDESPFGWGLMTGSLSLSLSRQGALVIRDLEGSTLFDAMPPHRSSGGWSQPIRPQPGERFYGLGERAAPLDLRGGRYRMWNSDPAGLAPGLDPLYLCVPVYLGLHETGSYLVFFENP